MSSTHYLKWVRTKTTSMRLSLARYLSPETFDSQKVSSARSISRQPVEKEPLLSEVFVLCKVDYSALGPHGDWVQAQGEAALGDLGLESEYEFVGYTHSWSISGGIWPTGGDAKMIDRLPYVVAMFRPRGKRRET